MTEANPESRKPAHGVRSAEDPVGHVRDIRYLSGGVQLFARSCGSGVPLVLLHGSGLSTHKSVAPLARELARQCQVITCDIRGFGRSVSRDPATHTWGQYALDVVALLDHLSIPRAAVGGYSLGSAIALVTALEHPDRVAGLILADSGFAGSEVGLTPAQERLWARSRSILLKARTQGLKAALVDAAVSQEERATLGAAVDEHDEQSVLAAHEGAVQTTQPFASLKALESVLIPALLLPGSDETHAPEITSWYAQHLPAANVGPPANSHPTVLAAAIRAFVTDTIKRKP